MVTRPNMDVLSDIKVIEIGSTVAGPYASQALAALGADVVKIEPPTGDPFRGEKDGMRAYFAMCNSGKRSLKLNLKETEGRQALLDLASETDVVIENYRPGVVDRLGVGYDDIAEVKEDIVYCSISGFGEESSQGDRAIFDPMLQGMTGLMSTTGEKDSDPVRIGVALIDLMTGVWSAVAILSTLHQRDRTGDGGFIDMRMYDVGVSMLTKKAAQYQRTGENPPRMGLESYGSHPYSGYTTADDKMVMVGAPHSAHWPRFCKAINREDLIDDDRFQSNQDRVDNREELNEILRNEFETKSRQEWVEIFEENRLPVGPVRTIEEALTNDVTIQNGIRSTLEHPEYDSVSILNLPLKINDERQDFTSPPPQVGEDSRDVLSEMGLSEAEIDELAEKEII